MKNIGFRVLALAALVALQTVLPVTALAESTEPVAPSPAPIALSARDEAQAGQAILTCLHPFGTYVYGDFRDGDSIAFADLYWNGITGTHHETDVAVELRTVDGEEEFRVVVLSDSFGVINSDCRYLSWTPVR